MIELPLILAGPFIAGALRCGPVQEVVQTLKTEYGERIVAMLYPAGESAQTPTVIVTQDPTDGAWTALTVVAGMACPAASGTRSAFVDPGVPPAPQGDPS